MSKHQLLSDYETPNAKTILENSVEVLNATNILNQYLSVDSERKIDYILKQLILHKKRIVDNNIFWKQIGHTVNMSHKLMAIVDKHPLLLHPTGTNNRMLERLVEELELTGDGIRIEYLLQTLQKKK
eukprot:271864_1